MGKKYCNLNGGECDFTFCKETNYPNRCTYLQIEEEYKETNGFGISPESIKFENMNLSEFSDAYNNGLEDGKKYSETHPSIELIKVIHEAIFFIDDIDDGNMYSSNDEYWKAIQLEAIRRILDKKR